MSERNALSGLWNSIQTWLFPVLEDEIGELDEKRRQFVAVCELHAPQNHLVAYRWIGNGCPPKNRLRGGIRRVFIYKTHPEERRQSNFGMGFARASGAGQPDGKIVWQWHDAGRAGSLHGVIVLDDLDTAVLNDDVSSVLGPVK